MNNAQSNFHGTKKAARLPKAVEPAIVLGAEDYARQIELADMPDLIAVGKVAALLGVSRSKVYHLIATGSLAAVRLGPGSLRVFRHSLVAFIRRSVQG